MPVQCIQTPAKCLGPYSPACKANGLIFVSGQLGVKDGALGATVEEQTKNALNNLKGILEVAGSSMSKVAKTQVMLKNISDFAAVNAIYAEAFGDHKPARICVEVAKLPMDALVEIDAIAAE
ncbi:Endoribonuclease L-PSP [Spironucleus salmonicida]|uniref:Endoribonuclease L-PSP n=1 Tax=Spironucleus salmonicida TaxID=348837 RepID=V6LJC1_9EUKA|nr:Endoribonuclease L-PSP [Spironucleus salmonicida]|eukprot:EST44670.1 Endoribonuclease L-PSP [Spironucleus salmonicida]